MPEFAAFLGPLVRGPDKWASEGGAYHAARSTAGRSRFHEGIDLVMAPGQPILAPFTGRMIRAADPYDDRKDTILNGIVFGGMDSLELKILYCSPAIRPGAIVPKGTVIAHAQSLEHLYPGITNHVHVEVSLAGQRVDPTPYFLPSMETA